ncbi:MAG: dihydrolipoyl dehydrogenase [Phycisphaerae bacterium]
MADTNFDVVIIGSGPGGYVAAVRAGQLGKKVACVERAELGGVCLNWGCIPTKTLINDAHFYKEMITQGPKVGLQVDASKFQWAKVVERSRGVAATLSKGIDFLFKKAKVQQFKGSAFIPKAGVVEVKNEKGEVIETLQARNILICTGARNKEIPGGAIKADGERIITSREAMVLKEIPQRLCIIGAGAIGVEFAYIYHEFGSKITLVEMLPHILPVEDEEVSDRLKTVFTRRGMDIRTSTRTEKVEVTPTGVKVTVTDLATKQTSTIEADKVLLAIGVTGNIEGLFAPNCTPLIEKGHLKVAKDFQTSIAGIYAAGDVIGPPWLAHVASFEATIAIERMFNINKREMDYTTIPGGTYCYPQVASVGLTEKQCKDRNLDYEVGKYSFAASGKALAINQPEGFVKLIFDKEHGELLGAHILGADATEMIAELVLAKRLEATKEEIYSTIHAHPTLSEAVMDAAASLGGGGHE